MSEVLDKLIHLDAVAPILVSSLQHGGRGGAKRMVPSAVLSSRASDLWPWIPTRDGLPLASLSSLYVSNKTPFGWRLLRGERDEHARPRWQRGTGRLTSNRSFICDSSSRFIWSSMAVPERQSHPAARARLFPPPPSATRPFTGTCLFRPRENLPALCSRALGDDQTETRPVRGAHTRALPLSATVLVSRRSVGALCSGATEGACSSYPTGQE